MASIQNSTFLQFHKEACEVTKLNIANEVALWKKNKKLPKKITNAMAYSLQAGGKRLRPTMAYAAATFLQPFSSKNFIEATKLSNTKRSIKVANLKGNTSSAAKSTQNKTAFNIEQLSPVIHCFSLAIEMIHTYSLIHDDLPAMDNDTLRRGKPTCHVKYGEDIAILAGDALLTEAFFCILNCYTIGNTSSKGNSATNILSTNQNQEGVLQALQYLSNCAGINGMVGGQGIDISNKAKTHKKIEEMHHLKTGKLIAASLVCPLILQNNYALVPPMEKYAKATGLLYQVTDDILDATKESKILGKNAGSDERNNKVTYTTLFGIAGSKQKAKELLQEINAATQEMHSILEAMPMKNRTKQEKNELISKQLEFFYQLGMHIYLRNY